MAAILEQNWAHLNIQLVMMRHQADRFGLLAIFKFRSGKDPFQGFRCRFTPGYYRAPLWGFESRAKPWIFFSSPGRANDGSQG